MAAVNVVIPHMLAELIGGERTHTVEAASAREALHALFERHGQLAVHVFDESGAVRPHVTLFHNGSLVDGDAEVTDGDKVTVLQAVSGG